MEHIHITIVIDVVKALVEGTLLGDTYMIDDSPFGSEGQGTASLATACTSGDKISWTVIPVDLQTDVAISGISFHGEADSQREDTPLRCKTWEGIVPCVLECERFSYKISLSLGRGKRGRMELDTPSLFVARPTT